VRDGFFDSGKQLSGLTLAQLAYILALLFSKVDDDRLSSGGGLLRGGFWGSSVVTIFGGCGGLGLNGHVGLLLDFS
jgi:hypothetical protein